MLKCKPNKNLMSVAVGMTRNNRCVASQQWNYITLQPYMFRHEIRMGRAAAYRTVKKKKKIQRPTFECYVMHPLVAHNS